MIPSMVSIAERAALRDFIALNYEGIGEVVEIGAFCGSSAIALMQGIQKTRHPKKLHVYDAFLFPKNDLEKVYRKLIPQCRGESFRDEFDFQTRQWKDAMVVNHGDAAQAEWTGGSIEFLHIDCSISREFHEAIAMEFYPHLCVNGVIAHQDFDYGNAPFIKEIMDAFGDAFKAIAHVGSTKYFRKQRDFTRQAIADALNPKASLAA